MKEEILNKYIDFIYEFCSGDADKYELKLRLKNKTEEKISKLLIKELCWLNGLKYLNECMIMDIRKISNDNQYGEGYVESKKRDKDLVVNLANLRPIFKNELLKSPIGKEY